MITRGKKRVSAAARMEPHLGEVFESSHQALIASYSANSFACLSTLGLVSRAIHEGSAKAWQSLIKGDDTCPTVETVIDTERLLRCHNHNLKLQKKGTQAVLRADAQGKVEACKDLRIQSLERASGMTLLQLNISRECYECVTVNRLPRFQVGMCRSCKEVVVHWPCRECNTLNTLREQGEHDGHEAFICGCEGCDCSGALFHFACIPKGATLPEKNFCKVAEYTEAGIEDGDIGCGMCKECCPCGNNRCESCDREFGEGVGQVTRCFDCGLCYQFCH